MKKSETLIYFVFTIAIISAGCTFAPKNQAANDSRPEATPIYKIEIIERQGIRLCNLNFSEPLPSAATVDRLIREAVEKAAKENPKKDILASAWLGEDELSPNQYSGGLVYKAATKKILTMDEFHGVKSSNSSTADYFVQTEEQQTVPGVTPKKTWLSLTIVYAKEPSRQTGYDAIVTEISKVAARGLDVNAYVSVGDKNVKTSWHQVRDTDGAYVFAEYQTATKQISRKGKVLKQL